MIVCLYLTLKILAPVACSHRTSRFFTFATLAMAAAAAPKLTLRPSGERGRCESGGWLSSKFTFSFADYYDDRFTSFGLLRVLNDDTVKSGGGFPTHSHNNAEIFSYILSGGLEHKDSMGHREVLGRGHVQFTSAGSGISHSEFNSDPTPGGRGTDVRFLQIWATPDKRGLKPGYQTGLFTDAMKQDKLCPILEPAAQRVPGSGALAINNGLRMVASLLSPGASVTLPLAGELKAYIHLPIMPGSAGVTVSTPGAADLLLSPGDGAFVENAAALTFRGMGQAAAAAEGGAAAPATTSTEFVCMYF